MHSRDHISIRYLTEGMIIPTQGSLEPTFRLEAPGGKGKLSFVLCTALSTLSSSQSNKTNHFLHENSKSHMQYHSTEERYSIATVLSGWKTMMAAKIIKMKI